MEVLEVSHLVKSYSGKTAVNDLSFSVVSGETLGLIGPNGAGKTTLIRILATLSQPTSGDVKLNGFNPVTEGDQVRKSIGVMTHHSFLYQALTASENLKFYGQMFEVEPLEETIEYLLDKVGLSSRKHDAVRTFSRGMQQRLSIARALLHSPPILLLDEPYTGLDYAATKMLQQILATYHSEGKTVLLTTHDMEKGLEQCDDIAIMARGELVYTGAANTIKMRSEKLKKNFQSVEIE